ARRTLDRVPPRRQAQAQIEPLGIDRFQLPSPAIGAAHAVTTREAGHARERHRPLPTEESWVIESGRDLSGEGERAQGQRARRDPTTLLWGPHGALRRAVRATLAPLRGRGCRACR